MDRLASLHVCLLVPKKLQSIIRQETEQSVTIHVSVFHVLKWMMTRQRESLRDGESRRILQDELASGLLARRKKLLPSSLAKVYNRCSRQTDGIYGSMCG